VERLRVPLRSRNTFLDKKRTWFVRSLGHVVGFQGCGIGTKHACFLDDEEQAIVLLDQFFLVISELVELANQRVGRCRQTSTNPMVGSRDCTLWQRPYPPNRQPLEKSHTTSSLAL
jgi:hypothetical protein